MQTKNLNIIQADIIYKALRYVCFHEGVEMNEETEKVFAVLAEINPNDTHASDALSVMEGLTEFIKTHEDYREYFEEEDEDEDDANGEDGQPT